MPREVVTPPPDVLEHASREIGQTVEGVLYALTHTRIQADVKDIRAWDLGNKRWKSDVQQFARAYDEGAKAERAKRG